MTSLGLVGLRLSQILDIDLGDGRFQFIVKRFIGGAAVGPGLDEVNKPFGLGQIDVKNELSRLDALNLPQTGITKRLEDLFLIGALSQ